MKRLGFLLLLLVAVGLASGTPAEGRRVTRRARVDVGHPDVEVELVAGLTMMPAMVPSHPVAAALPGWAVRLRPREVVRVATPRLSSSSPAEPAVVAACSRAPPLLS